MKILSKIAAIFKPYPKQEPTPIAAPINPPINKAPASAKWPFEQNEKPVLDSQYPDGDGYWVDGVAKTDTQDTYSRPKKKAPAKPATKKKNWNSGQKKPAPKK
jgi:hypothetical protein